MDNELSLQIFGLLFFPLCFSCVSTRHESKSTDRMRGLVCCIDAEDEHKEQIDYRIRSCVEARSDLRHRAVATQHCQLASKRIGQVVDGAVGLLFGRSAGAIRHWQYAPPLSTKSPHSCSLNATAMDEDELVTDEQKRACHEVQQSSS